MQTENPIGLENQIEDVLFGKNTQQLQEIERKVQYAISNIDRIVSVNGKKVYNVSINRTTGDICFNLRNKKGDKVTTNWYYPIQYAKILYS